MRSLRLLSANTFLLSTLVLAQSTSLINSPVLSQPNAATQASISENYGKLPLSFEANHGQAGPQVKFLTRTSGYSLFLTGDEAVFALSGKMVKIRSPQGLKPASLTGADGTANAVPFPKTIYGTISDKNNVAADRITGGVLRMKLRNANPAAKVTGIDELAGTTNYFIGNDPAKWRTKVPTYAKVKYEGIYSGIDLVYYGNQRQLEYDFIVAPGADFHRIAFDVRGAQAITQDAHGDLVFKVSEDEVRWHKPVVYQEKNGARQQIAAHYAITDTNRVAFELAKYDSTRPLYIDPLIYSSYLGGSGSDGGSSIAVDHAGNAYVTGSTSSTDFPTMDPLQPTNHSTAQYPSNAFVTKINPAGSALVYSTYLGGSGDDFGNGIAVDRSGDAYLIGFTSSTDFPTKNPIQPSNAGAGNGTGNTAFVAKLNSTGSALVYSTYLGGSSGDDVGNGIAADSSGNAYVIGSTQSSDFPVTPGAFQTTCVVLNYHSCQTVFVSKINKTGSALVYSTYLGGSGGPRGNGEFGEGIAADSAGNAYVTGYTYSTDFPTKNPLQPNNKSANAFISKINPAGSALVYSTYLGGSEWDSGQAIAVDGNGNVYVTGAAGSYDFPTKNPLQPTLAGDVDAFAAKINSAGSALIYSTFLGGGRNINTGNPGESGGTAIAADSSGNTYVTGGTTSPTFPLWNPYQSWFAGIEDAFVTKINATGSAFDYSTYFGSQTWNYSSYGSGIAADSSGNAYVTGGTDSPTLPTMNAFQPTYAGDNDAFVAKINVKGLAKTKTSLTSSPNPSSDGQPVTFTAVVSSKLGPPYNYEMVTFEMGTAVLGQGTLLNGSASFTTSTLPVGTDSVKAVYVGDATHAGSNSNVVKQVVQ